MFEEGLHEGGQLPLGGAALDVRDVVDVARALLVEHPAAVADVEAGVARLGEKDAELGDRALDYLYVLADRYYKDAESSAETPPDTATS